MKATDVVDTLLGEAAGRKPYTVVGFYSDNDQPFVWHAHGADPMNAVLQTIEEIAKGRVDEGEDWGAEARLIADEIMIVEVFAGHQQGLFENDSVISAKELLF